MNGASREAALKIIDNLISKRISQNERLMALKKYLKENPPPSEVEELLWSLLISKEGGYYL